MKNSFDPKKHHRRSIRLRYHDYRQNGAYFITICTKNRRPIFGINDKNGMKLSNCGQIASQCIREIPDHFHHIYVHAHIVMPDHVHVLLEIRKIDETPLRPKAPMDHKPPINRDDGRRGMACHAPATPRRFGQPENGSISTIVGAFKSAVSKHIRAMNHSNEIIWQRNFHEWIIRDENHFQNVMRYIANNPKKHYLQNFLKRIKTIKTIPPEKSINKSCMVSPIEG